MRAHGTPALGETISTPVRISAVPTLPFLNSVRTDGVAKKMNGSGYGE